MANDWSDWSEEEIKTLTAEDCVKREKENSESKSICTDNDDGIKPDSSKTENRSGGKDESLRTSNEQTECKHEHANCEPKSAPLTDDVGEMKDEINTMNCESKTLLSPSFSEYRNHSDKGKESDGDFEQSKSFTSSVESEKENDTQHQTPSTQKKTRRIRKRKTRQKLRYVSSPDEDIPLSVYAKCAWNTSFNTSDTDNAYDPEKEEELNSTDSEYQDIISQKCLTKLQKDKCMKQQWNKTVKMLKKKTQKSNKEESLTRKVKMQTEESILLSQTEENSNRTAEVIKQVLENSAKAANLRQELIQSQIVKIESLLAANNLVRDKIKPHGNCFFEASGKQIGMDPSSLRNELCKSLEDNIEEYIAFILNHHHPDDQETFVADYLSEIEKLKRDGYWTSSVADLLPLVLANYSKRNIVIYTNHEDQPIVGVKPSNTDSCAVADQSNSINLVYTSIPGTFEHYDACLENAQQEIFTATPLLGDVKSKQSKQQDKQTPQKKAAPVKKSTPRKKAVFITPEKKLLTRKRKATPENWKKNIRKKLRLSGAQYTSTDGKSKAAREMKAVDCSKCRLKCETKITSQQRQQLFESFWSLANYQRQKDYICARIKETSTKTYLDEEGKAKSKRKQVARKFSFEIEGEKYSVCKKFFMNTLSVGKAYIDHAMKSKKDGHFAGNNLRGKHVPHNKLPKCRTDEVKKHIESFPRIAAHYVRRETSRQFLGPELTLRKMYDLYTEECKSYDTDPVTLEKYRDIFNKNYNLSFHVPKKDQCNTCNVYNRALEQGTVTEEQKASYEKHQQRKQRAREEKERDKTEARSKSNIHVACFDLQSVLYTPCSLVSLMYYMRKLCCYNFTVYSLGNHQGTCFVWSEVDAKRGASEVATCLKLHLQSLPAEVDHVVLYSDACGGQNRNRIIASCLTIDHKFLESGHTHMEVDSMHSAVEFAKKKTQIFVPSQWDTVLQMARRRNPYTVIPLKHSDIIDFKQYQSISMKTPKKAESGAKVEWTKMKWMRYVKDEPDVCYIKYDIDRDFEKLKILGSRRQHANVAEPLPMKYQSKLPISAAKKKDLLQLCRSGVIPQEFHEYYKSLPSSNSKRDCLPEPDMIEDSSNDSD